MLLQLKCSSAYQATKLVDQASLFPDRLQSIKHMLFGPDNQRAILTSGLKPSLSEIGDIFDQSSGTYRTHLRSLRF
jgi:hypothetical protein